MYSERSQSNTLLEDTFSLHNTFHCQFSHAGCLGLIFLKLEGMKKHRTQQDAWGYYLTALISKHLNNAF